MVYFIHSLICFGYDTTLIIFSLDNIVCYLRFNYIYLIFYMYILAYGYSPLFIGSILLNYLCFLSLSNLFNCARFVYVKFIIFLVFLYIIIWVSSRPATFQSSSVYKFNLNQNEPANFKLIPLKMTVYPIDTIKVGIVYFFRVIHTRIRRVNCEFQQNLIIYYS